MAEAATICRVEGDLDAYQAPLVRERFSHLSGRTAVVIDLVAVRFVDSCGLSVVRHWIRRLQAEGRTVHLRLAPGPVVPIFAPWIDPDRFVPISSVLAGSGLSNTFQSGLDDNGKGALAGLFFVGDAVSTTNPSLGRGISLGLRQAAELLGLIARDGRDLRGAAERFDAWCTEHIRPWYEDHVYVDTSLLARFRGEKLDIDAPLPSDVIVATARKDPSMMPVLVPFLAMVTLPTSLKEVEGAARAVLRTGWRPPYADGPSASALAEVVSSSSLSTSAKP